MMRRFETILAIAAVGIAAVASSATAKPVAGAASNSGATAIALTQKDYATSCAPADIRTGPYRCFAQPFGTPSRFGMQINIGSGASPTPVSMQGDGLLSF